MSMSEDQLMWKTIKYKILNVGYGGWTYQNQEGKLTGRKE